MDQQVVFSWETSVAFRACIFLYILVDLLFMLRAVEFLWKGHATVVRALVRLPVVMNIHMLVELSSFVSIHEFVTYFTVVHFKFLVEFYFVVIFVFVDGLDWQVLSLVLREYLREVLNDSIDPWIILRATNIHQLINQWTWVIFVIYKFSEDLVIHQVAVA